MGPLRPLVAVRGATPFDPDFVARDPLLSTIEPAYRRVGRHRDFPDLSALQRVFLGTPPVRFVVAEAKRRRGAPVDVGRLYDSRITVEGVVPTRPRCWHDFMNALVWGTFPRSKLALHARQHRAISARVQDGARTLRPRNPELDALAVLDEGGVLVVVGARHLPIPRSEPTRSASLPELLGRGDARVLVFGHAIYESLALGVPPAVVAATLIVAEGEPATVEVADGLFAEALADTTRFLEPRQLARLDLQGICRGSPPERAG